ncbi:MAG: hypothetical protein ACWGMZ_04745 [Thermoguttaceae bacterium]
MEKDSCNWHDFFSRWPADLPHRGIVITTFNEQILFSAFWTTDAFLMLERQTPDSLGARTIILSYSQIVALKIVDVLKPKQVKAAGFVGISSPNF